MRNKKNICIVLLLSTITSISCVQSAQAAFERGFYAGGLFGGEYFSGKRSDSLADNISGVDPASRFNRNFDTTDFGYEFFVGYQLVWGAFLLGLEPFGSYKLNKSKVTLQSVDPVDPTLVDNFNYSVKRTWDFGGVVRLGYIFRDVWLIYLLLGPEVGRFAYNAWATDDPEGAQAKAHQWLWGLRYGIGLERILEEFWGAIIGLQVSQTRFSSHTFSGSTLDAETGVVETLSTYIKPRVLDFSLRVSLPF